jgi:hypothetical protein
MLNEKYKGSLLILKKSINGADAVAKLFPRCLMEFLRCVYVTNMYGQLQTICYDYEKSHEFQIRLGFAIHNNNFDAIDDILIEFINTYHYKILTPDFKLVMFPVNIPKEAESVFRKICNSFKGKEWDNILPELVDTLYAFTSTITIHGDKIQCP